MDILVRVLKYIVFVFIVSNIVIYLELSCENCSVNANCIRGRGVKCVCRDGFTGNGTSCEPGIKLNYYCYNNGN